MNKNNKNKKINKQNSERKSQHVVTEKPLLQQVVKQKRSLAIFKHALPHLKVLDTLNLQEAKEEVALIRGVIRGMFNGNQTYHFYLGSVFVPTTYTTTGTIATVQPFYTDITNSLNWSPLSSIFDEFALVEIKHSLCPISSAFNAAMPYPTFTAYDDDGGLTASGLYGLAQGIVQYATVKMHCPAVQGATLATEANSTGFHPITTSFTRPYDANSGPALVNTYTTGWCSVGGPTYLLGSYYIYNGSVSASSSVSAYYVMTQTKVAFRFTR